MRTSAKCLFRSGAASSPDRRTSTVERLDASAVSCPSESTAVAGAGAGAGAVASAGAAASAADAPRLTDVAGGKLLTSSIGVALNGAYVQEDSTDYVGVANVCPEASFGAFQTFVQYTQTVSRIEPTGGPIRGGTTVTVSGEGFMPIGTPSLEPGLLAPSVRCLWGCPEQPSTPSTAFH